MKGLPFVLLFTAVTFVSWGAYGPVLHHGAVALDHDSMRAFVGVGLAYFLIAVLIPLFILRKRGEVGSWTISGTAFSFVAGVVGAIGALGIILALGYGGDVIVVMPLVFGFAPIVNTLVSAFLSRTFRQISPVFIAGIVAAALGAGGVLYFKNPLPLDAASTPAAETVTDDDGDLETMPEVTGTEVARPTEDESGNQTANPARSSNSVGIFLSIITAALCWGSYGPMLHVGQSKMQGSRLRPFACVGLAYFLIAVVIPLIAIYSRTTDAGSWTPMGMSWSFLAGVAGAIGALGVILAFNWGGKPYYVMPLIFGFAPVINTFISLTESGTWSLVRPMFWVSLAVVIAGAVIVLTNAPRPKPVQNT